MAGEELGRVVLFVANSPLTLDDDITKILPQTSSGRETIDHRRRLCHPQGYREHDLQLGAASPTRHESDKQGHELCGIVVQSGPRCPRSRSAGVTWASSQTACGDCFFCKQKLSSQCERTNSHSTAKVLYREEMIMMSWRKVRWSATATLMTVPS